jgi:hypothetical protein
MELVEPMLNLVESLWHKRDMLICKHDNDWTILPLDYTYVIMDLNIVAVDIPNFLELYWMIEKVINVWNKQLVKAIM